MRARLIPSAGLVWFITTLTLLTASALSAPAAEMKLESLLLWGTNDPKPPPGKDYKPLDPEIRRKLEELPLKWTNWFIVNRKRFGVAPGDTKEMPMSDKCQLNVKNVANRDVEVWLIGKGKEVVRQKQSLPKDHLLMLGGKDPGTTAWLVVLRRLE
jgi:hypothetical protein